MLRSIHFLDRAIALYIYIYIYDGIDIIANAYIANQRNHLEI